VDFIFVDATVSFNQSAYSVGESDELAHFGLILSKPASFAYRVRIIATDRSATGEQYSSL